MSMEIEYEVTPEQPPESLLREGQSISTTLAGEAGATIHPRPCSDCADRNWGLSLLSMRYAFQQKLERKAAYSRPSGYWYSKQSR